MIFLWIILSVIIVSLISLVGLAFFKLKGKKLEKILILLMALASGALLGGAFFHLIPEAISLGTEKVAIFTLLGIMLFFVLEKFVHWRHCHKSKCKIHAFTYTILIGDALHNFIDGLVIAAAYIININLGIITTLAIILHEIPQEIGDFGVLLYGGFKRKKALLYNFLIALTAIAGSIIGYFLKGAFETTFLLPIAAGGFIYIATTDLIPELHKRKTLPESILQFLIILAGLVLMWLIKFLH